MADNILNREAIKVKVKELFDTVKATASDVKEDPRVILEMLNTTYEQAFYFWRNEVDRRKILGIFEHNSPYIYYCIYIIPLVWLLSTFVGNVMYFVVPMCFFGIIPILEMLRGPELVNPKEEDYHKLQSDLRYRWSVWFWIVPQFCMLIYGAYLAGTGSWFDVVCLALMTGCITGGVGITVAHELIHRTAETEKILGQSLLMSVLYGHFFIEHLWGHHKNVATCLDAATARYGENVYQFWARCIPESYRSAWKLAQRYKKTHIMAIQHFLQVMYLWYMFTIGGINGVVFVILQSIVAILILETINYIEHYGLTRDTGENVNRHHSWNTDARVTNYLAFRLQRHSDHHENATRRYPNLRNFPESPQLPTGYTGCIVMAWIPPLWFKFMNPRVKVYNNVKKDM